MELHRRTLTVCLILISLLLASHTVVIAADWSMRTGSSHSYDRADGYIDHEKLAAFRPGDPIGWLLATGEVGNGDIVATDSTSITTTSGVRLDQTTCLALWRPNRRKGTSIAVNRSDA